MLLKQVKLLYAKGPFCLHLSAEAADSCSALTLRDLFIHTFRMQNDFPHMWMVLNFVTILKSLRFKVIDFSFWMGFCLLYGRKERFSSLAAASCNISSSKLCREGMKRPERERERLFSFPLRFNNPPFRHKQGFTASAELTTIHFLYEASLGSSKTGWERSWKKNCQTLYLHHSAASLHLKSSLA